jgi:ribosomal protein S12 methylthiotransferase
MGFVQEARFYRLGVFEFSPEEGTPAAEMSGQVPEEERRRRRGRLMELQQGISLERNRRLVGSEIDVLIERVTSRGAVGRTEGDAPEVDGTVIIRGCRKAPGSFVRVRVTDADVYDITAREAAGTAFGAGRMSMEANKR